MVWTFGALLLVILGFLSWLVLYSSILLPVLNHFFDSHVIRTLQANRSYIVQMIVQSAFMLGLLFFVFSYMSSIMIKLLVGILAILAVYFNVKNIKRIMG